MELNLVQSRLNDPIKLYYGILFLFDSNLGTMRIFLECIQTQQTALIISETPADFGYASWTKLKKKQKGAKKKGYFSNIFIDHFYSIHGYAGLL